MIRLILKEDLTGDIFCALQRRRFHQDLGGFCPSMKQWSFWLSGVIKLQLAI